jgi:hypothetical protein
MNITTRFTEEMVSLAKSYCDDPDEAAGAIRGGSFAEYAMISRHGLRGICEPLVGLQEDTCSCNVLGLAFPGRDESLKRVSLFLGEIDDVLFPAHSYR